MGRFGDNLATNYRIAMGMFSAVGVLSLATWAIFFTDGSFEHESIRAVVTAIELRSDQSDIAYIQVKPANYDQIELFSSIKPLPEVGDSIPLILETSSSGSKSFWVDHQQWQEEKLLY